MSNFDVESDRPAAKRGRVSCGLAIATAHPSLAPRGPREQVQQGSSGSISSQPSDGRALDGVGFGPRLRPISANLRQNSFAGPQTVIQRKIHEP